jgi:hypothetical protein
MMFQDMSACETAMILSKVDQNKVVFMKIQSMNEDNTGNVEFMKLGNLEQEKEDQKDYKGKSSPIVEMISVMYSNKAAEGQESSKAGTKNKE